MESNGPETKVRGPAAVIYERYLQLARDATSSGDRVLGENYLQHADHYFRLVRSMQPAQPHPQQQQQDRFNDAEREGDDEGSHEMDRAEGGEASAEGDEQPDAEFSQGQQNQGQDREGGNRRRGRRNRFRPEGGEGAEAREGGGEERSETARRANRALMAKPANHAVNARRANNGSNAKSRPGPEGFSNGPKPAFLRGD